MPLEKKYENNADIAAQQSIEIGKQRLLSKLYCKTHASIVWHGNKLIFQAQFIQDRLDNV